MERKKGYEYIRINKSMKINFFNNTVYKTRRYIEQISIHSLGLIIVISYRFVAA